MSPAPSKASEPEMRTIKLTTGAALTLDGDLLSVLEVLYKEISANIELQSNVIPLIPLLPTTSPRRCCCSAVRSRRGRRSRWRGAWPTAVRSQRRSPRQRVTSSAKRRAIAPNVWHGSARHVSAR